MKEKIKYFLLGNKLFSPLVRRYHFTSLVHSAMGDCENVLDLGCGVMSYVQGKVPKPYSEGVDLFESSINLAKSRNIHDKYHMMDVMEIGTKFAENSFDCVMAMDLVEHLEKADSEKLLDMMERVAKKRVIVFTPNGYLPQGEHYGNPWQLHRCGWTAAEMKNRGYHVIGYGGLKLLRPEFEIKWWPKFFWRFLSTLSQLIARDVPQWSFSILCVKEK